MFSQVAPPVGCEDTEVHWGMISAQSNSEQRTCTTSPSERVKHRLISLISLSMSFSVLQVFPDPVSLRSLVSGQLPHLDALQDHGYSAEPQSLQQHGGLHRPDLHQRSGTVLQHPGHQAHNPARGHHLSLNITDQLKLQWLSFTTTTECGLKHDAFRK